MSLLRHAAARRQRAADICCRCYERDMLRVAAGYGACAMLMLQRQRRQRYVTR